MKFIGPFLILFILLLLVNPSVSFLIFVISIILLASLVWFSYLNYKRLNFLSFIANFYIIFFLCLAIGAWKLGFVGNILFVDPNTMPYLLNGKVVFVSVLGGLAFLLGQIIFYKGRCTDNSVIDANILTFNWLEKGNRIYFLMGLTVLSWISLYFTSYSFIWTEMHLAKSPTGILLRYIAFWLILNFCDLDGYKS